MFLHVVERFVIKYRNKVTFVALDQHSGGYPFEVAIDRANYWPTVEGAEKYKSHFKDSDNFEICRLTLTVESMDDEPLP
jgi:hypothetical protein